MLHSSSLCCTRELKIALHLDVSKSAFLVLPLKLMHIAYTKGSIFKQEIKQNIIHSSIFSSLQFSIKVGMSL